MSEPVHLESCDSVHFDHDDDGDRDIDDSNDVRLRFPPQILNRDVVVGYRCLKKKDGRWMGPRDK